jgi:hypothetical protein
MSSNIGRPEHRRTKLGSYDLSSDTSITFESGAKTFFTNVQSEYEKSYVAYVPSYLVTQLEDMSNQISIMHDEIQRLRNDSSNIQWSKMKQIADDIIASKNIPAGRYITITHSGELVAEADSKIALLKKINQVDGDDIFIWKSGFDAIDSW